MSSRVLSRIGLVHEICDEAGLAGAAERMLANRHPGGPSAITAIGPLATGVPPTPEPVGITSRRSAELRASPEAREGLAAFPAKRRARRVAARAPLGKLAGKRRAGR
ncbi:MAG: hypothetical protein IT529_22050 [Burkholderiales bacterium]|nr:hypothetical protein [Burkholderiales bacterium]